MRRILPVIICFFCFTAAYAQVKTASFYYKSGLQLTEQNKFPEAITAFNNAIKLNKKFDSAYVQAADLYSKSGNWDAAFFNYKKAISINPKFSNAFAGMGKFYRNKI